MNQKWLRPMIRKNIQEFNAEIPKVKSSYRKLVDDSLSQIVSPQVKSELDVSRVARQARPIYPRGESNMHGALSALGGHGYYQITDAFGQD